MKKRISNNPCRKIKPSDPDGLFVYPSAEFEDSNSLDKFADVRRYFRDIKEHFGSDIQGLKKELQFFRDTYARQHQFFTNSIVKQAIRDKRRAWCRGAIEEAIRFSNCL